MLFVLVNDGVHPQYDSLASWAIYLTLVAIPLALFLYFLRMGFTYRRIEANRTGLEIIAAYYGVFWSRDFIPSHDIQAVEQHDYLAGVFAKGPCSELRVVLRDGSTITVTANNGVGRYVREAVALGRAFGIDSDNAP